MAVRLRNIKFSTGRIKSKVRGAKAAAGKQVAREMKADLKQVVSTPFPPPSRPGRPPHARRGLAGGLQGTLDVVFRNGEIVIRLPQHGIFLEGGTRNMDPRPFVDPTIRKKRLTWERRMRALIRQRTKGSK